MPTYETATDWRIDRAQLEKDFAEGEDGDESFEDDSVVAGDDENEGAPLTPPPAGSDAIPAAEEDVFDKDNDYLEMLAKAQVSLFGLQIE